jgi:hypothetical protein
MTRETKKKLHSFGSGLRVLSIEISAPVSDDLTSEYRDLPPQVRHVVAAEAVAHR